MLSIYPKLGVFFLLCYNGAIADILARWLRLKLCAVQSCLAGSLESEERLVGGTLACSFARCSFTVATFR